MGSTKPWVSAEQLLEMAQRGALVRWWPSDVVEQIKLIQHGPGSDVVAQNLITGQKHRILPMKHYYLVEIAENAKVTVGDMLNAKARANFKNTRRTVAHKSRRKGGGTGSDPSQGKSST